MSDLRLDPENARKHSERNAALVRQSLEEVGPFRSIAVDGDDIIRAGNLTYREAEKLGLKMRVVEAAPDELIVVKRPDLRGRAAKRAGLYDNRSSDPDVGSEWDAEVIARIQERDAALLAGVFERDEVAETLGRVVAQDYSDFDAELAALDGMEDAIIAITVPAMHQGDVRAWLANGESQTAPGMGKGVLRRCGLL